MADIKLREIVTTQNYERQLVMYVYRSHDLREGANRHFRQAYQKWIAKCERHAHDLRLVESFQDIRREGKSVL